LSTDLPTSTSKVPVNIFTVDVEDWYHGISGYTNVQAPTSRIEYSIPKMIALLKKYNVTATFFVLGEVAQKYPELVEEIIHAGHEIGCHCFKHKHLGEIGCAAFNQDLKKATHLLERLSGKPIVSFRAPLFSITKSTLWAIEIINRQGYLFDSSIFPSFHPFYGIPDEPVFPHQRTCLNNTKDCPTNNHKSNEVIEFPVLTKKILNVNLPVGGGAYLRFLREKFFINSIQLMNKKNLPATLYIHPWEIDSFIPSIKFNALIKFITYYNITETETYLENLFKSFRFVSIQQFAKRFLE
jgi:polysaccharide deacetylase family protein (PEP-CTERM system associated)